jgi:hypothetical protein
LLVKKQLRTMIRTLEAEPEPEPIGDQESGAESAINEGEAAPPEAAAEKSADNKPSPKPVASTEATAITREPAEEQPAEQ